MTTPWIVAFCILTGSVILLFVVVLGLVRRALAVLEDGASGGDVYTNSLRVANMYGGIPPGTVVPEFLAKDTAGSVLSTRELFPEPRLCLFVTTDCVPCATLLADLQASPDGLDVPLLVFVDDLHDPKYASLPSNVTVVEQADGAASNAFRSRAYPQAFAVGPDGVVRGVAIPNSLADLRQLARALEGGDRRATVTQTAAA
jgi:hypothetical protein